MGVPAASIFWHDGRRALPAREVLGQLTKARHRGDLAYHEAALDGLKRGRERRGWGTKEMVTAIVGFEQRHGRWPNQRDFRSHNGLPGYATLWRRFGSIAAAVELAAVEKRAGRAAEGPGWV